jgi:polysaccharide deacetylase 2 family uncharacterized protein YibQ
MRLAFSSEDRLVPAESEEERSGLGGALVIGLLLPFTLIAVGFSGWYMATGETPLDIKDRLTHGPRIVLPMPARPGSENPGDAMIKPPVGNQAPALSPMQMPVAPTAAKAPEEKPAETKPAPAAETKPVAPPQITLPSAAPAEPAPAPVAEKPAPVAKSAPAPAPVAQVSSFVAPPPPPPLDEPVTPPAGESLAPPSFAQLPTPKEAAKPLAPAPLPDLLRQTAAGSLPIRAAGKEAWKVYSRPVTVAQTKPGAKIAVVVTGLGLSLDGTNAAINKLPGDISLAFSPYGAGIAEWMKRAREDGHEVLLDLPLEPINFPAHDAGPLAVLQGHSPGEALGHLDMVLGKAAGYVGVIAPLHSPVTATDSWALILNELKDRGLLFVGDGLVGIEDKSMPAAGLVTLAADETPFRAAIDNKLARALAAAQRDGSAIITVEARPVSFERLMAFIASFPEKNITLVPVSALVRPEP